MCTARTRNQYTKSTRRNVLLVEAKVKPELTRTEYLYNIKPEVIRDMPNLESLYYRKKHAKLLTRELVKVHHTEQDDERLNEVLAALKWLDRAIKELT